MARTTPLSALPGGDLVRRGLADLVEGRETAEALLVAIGADRIRAAGLDVPEVRIAEPEHRLYALLEAEDPAAAHASYNALLRRLVSFERALEGGRFGQARRDVAGPPVETDDASRADTAAGGDRLQPASVEVETGDASRADAAGS